MIQFKDIKNKVYSQSKQCIRFELQLEVDDQMYELFFYTPHEERTLWRLKVDLPATPEEESRRYVFSYQLPTTNSISLERIAALGVRYMQLYLQEEIQKTSNIAFALGTFLEGMIQT